MGAISNASAARQIVPAQSTAISFVDDHGDAITITSEDVRMHICPQADAKEVAYFMELCRAQRLNPFLNEAYLVKFQGKPAQIMVAHKALVKRAEAHPQYDGMQHGVIIAKGGEYEHREGCAYPGEQLVGGWCKVYRKDRRMPVYAERSLSSMSKGQANWKTMPDVMIDKCAQAAALREAFPDELRAMYVQEEMGTIPAQAVTVEQSAPPQSNTRIAQSPKQRPKASEGDVDWLRNATAQLVTDGYDEATVKRDLWHEYQTGGKDAAAAWVASQRAALLESQPEYDVEDAPVGVDADTGEIGPDFDPSESEIDIADEDIPFPDA